MLFSHKDLTVQDADVVTADLLHFRNLSLIKSLGDYRESEKDEKIRLTGLSTHEPFRYVSCTDPTKGGVI